LLDGKEVFVCFLPVYHVYALTCVLTFMKIGAHNILIANPRDMHALILYRPGCLHRPMPHAIGWSKPLLS
jgi:hypothetical protein